VPPGSAFEYALIRIVPRIERGECMNAGVVLLCRNRRFLDARLHIDHARLAAFAPDLDLPAIEEQLEHLALTCKGGADAGPIGELPLYERFRWITAPRSTIVQPSPVHCGLCEDPRETLEALFTKLVG
jgi:hypothetical protein